MMPSLYTAATGMLGMQLNIDVVANNIANVNTVGFKKSRAEFADLMYQVLEYPGTNTSADTRSPAGIEYGLGVRATSITKVFTEGNLQSTENQFDVAISGRGFFKIQMPDGTEAYTRDGAFKLDENGQVVNSDGYFLLPNFTVPADTTSVSVATDGTVTATNSTGQTQQLGNLTVTLFVNPAGLHSLGDNLFMQTDSSGNPQDETPGQNGAGILRQGFLELSNVQLVTELTDLITGQRAYDANSKVITTSDEMLQTTTNLIR